MRCPLETLTRFINMPYSIWIILSHLLHLLAFLHFQTYVSTGITCHLHYQGIGIPLFKTSRSKNIVEQILDL